MFVENTERIRLESTRVIEMKNRFVSLSTVSAEAFRFLRFSLILASVQVFAAWVILIHTEAQPERELELMKTAAELYAASLAVLLFGVLGSLLLEERAHKLR